MNPSFAPYARALISAVQSFKPSTKPVSAYQAGYTRGRKGHSYGNPFCKNVEPEQHNEFRIGWNEGAASRLTVK